MKKIFITLLFFCTSYLRGQELNSKTIKIPVIFHVVYSNASHVHRTDGGNKYENISDSLLLTELKDLHDDFLKLNTDLSEIDPKLLILVGNPNVEFYLADTIMQENGKKGIIRIHNEKNNDNPYEVSKIIDNKRFLNIYVCDLGSSTNSEPWLKPESDGVILSFSWVGLHNRLSTHEVGHWLGLYHIWGEIGSCNKLKCLFSDHNDGIDDTPEQSICTDTYSTKCPPEVKVRSALKGINYMDYSSCRKMFTVGQASRMRENIIKHRNTFCR